MLQAASTTVILSEPAAMRRCLAISKDGHTDVAPFEAVAPRRHLRVTMNFDGSTCFGTKCVSMAPNLLN